MQERVPSMRIVIADDHAMFRNSVAAVLTRAGFEVTGEASDGYEAVDLVESTRPDAVVMDMNMPRLNGIEARLLMAQKGLRAKTVVLTMYGDEVSVEHAFKAGVEAYVLKTQASTDLITALEALEQGNVYLSPRVSEALVGKYLRNQPERSDALTSRERQILQLVAEGNPTRAIATTLNLTVKTIECYRNRLLKKLDTNNLAGLVRHAVREGVIRP